MYALKERIRTIKCQMDLERTFTKLRSIIRLHQLEILNDNRATGRIACRCLSMCVNLLFWRCWSDELLFELKAVGKSQTEVSIFAIPNLMRIRVKRSETVADPDEIVSRIEVGMVKP